MADRVLATKLGAHAVGVFAEHGTSVMVGEAAGKLRTTPLRETYEHKKPLDDYLLRIHPDVST